MSKQIQHLSYKRQAFPVITISGELHWTGYIVLSDTMPQQRMVTGYVAVGTGLACERISRAQGYCVIHLASGCALSNYRVRSLSQAKQWIEALAPLADWTQEAEQIVVRCGLARAIEHTYTQIVCAHMEVNA